MAVRKGNILTLLLTKKRDRRERSQANVLHEMTLTRALNACSASNTPIHPRIGFMIKLQIAFKIFYNTNSETKNASFYKFFVKLRMHNVGLYNNIADMNESWMLYT